MGGPGKINASILFKHLIDNQMRKMSHLKSLLRISAPPVVNVIRATAFIIMVFSVSTLKSHAQDLIRLKSGKEIKANVIEEGTDIIKYREFDNPTGPVYSVKKDLVEAVKYKKGNRPSQTQLVENNKSEIQVQADTGRYLTVKKRYVLLNGQIQSPRNIKSMMEEYPDAAAMYEKGRKMCNFSNTCAFSVIIVSLTASIMENSKSNQDDVRHIAVIGLSIDGAFIITGAVLASIGKKNIRSSVALYNSTLKKPVSYKLDFGLQDHGVGFALKF